MKGVTIIIPCYKAGNYILDLYKSVAIQPIECPWEIIIVDDCSDDKETYAALNTIENDDNVIVKRLVKHRGTQFCRNTAIKLAKYDYILPLDADDCLNTNVDFDKFGTYMDNGVNILSKNQKVAFVHGLSMMFDKFDGFTISAYPVTVDLILQKHHAQTHIIYRKKDAIMAGAYDINIKKWQDWSFAVALLNARYIKGLKNEIAYLNVPYHLYRVHGKVPRLSNQPVDEKEMTFLTIKKNRKIFQDFYGLKNLDKLVDLVISHKPNRLIDLLYVANSDVQRAIKMVEQRHYDLCTDLCLESIP